MYVTMKPVHAMQEVANQLHIMYQISHHVYYSYYTYYMFCFAYVYNYSSPSNHIYHICTVLYVIIVLYVQSVFTCLLRRLHCLHSFGTP